MKLTDLFTLCVVLDETHAREMSVVWPTWKAHRPELLQIPMLAIVDRTLSDIDLSLLGHPSLKVVDCRAVNTTDHREFMLSQFVFTTPFEVSTPYFLKLDTDVVAYRHPMWLDQQWFENDPVFVASSWGYTKPADAIQQLDSWGDRIPALFGNRGPLNIPYVRGSGRVVHPRVISWLYFGRTDWHRRLAASCGDRLPVPSQDTTCWYAAERRKDFYRRVRFSRYGWRHINGIQRLRVAAAQSLGLGAAA